MQSDMLLIMYGCFFGCTNGFRGHWKPDFCLGLEFTHTALILTTGTHAKRAGDYNSAHLATKENEAQ